MVARMICQDPPALCSGKKTFSKYPQSVSDSGGLIDIYSQRELDNMDISGKIGPLDLDREYSAFPMYSYSRPAYIFWNGFATGLAKLGKSEAEIMDILQSKDVRHILDGMDNRIRELGEAIAISEYLKDGYKCRAGIND